MKPIVSKLANAVYFFDVDKTKEIIKSGMVSIDDIKDIEVCYEPNFPLWYLTKCWEEVLLDEKWNGDDIWKIILGHREKNCKIAELWRDFIGEEYDKDIQFHLYDWAVYLDDPRINSKNDILGWPEEEFIQNGCRQIDLDLYCAYRIMDFKNAEELIKQGANPNVNLHPISEMRRESPDGCFTLNTIETEISLMFDNSISDILLEMPSYKDTNILNTDNRMFFIGYLMNLAAYEKMYRIMTKIR